LNFALFASAAELRAQGETFMRSSEVARPKGAREIVSFQRGLCGIERPQRRKHSAECKARIAVEAVKGVKTVQQFAASN
jgi:hypothetical protein